MTTIHLDPPTPEDLAAARRLLRRYGLTDDHEIVGVACYGDGRNPRELMKAAGTAVLGMTCYACKTRKLDPSNKDALGLELCPQCLTEAEMENEHNDGYHDEPVVGCAQCQAAAEIAQSPGDYR